MSKSTAGFSIANLRVDKDRSEGGVWVDYATGQVVPEHTVKAPANASKLFVRVARLGNPKFLEAMQESGTTGAALNLARVRGGSIDPASMSDQAKKAVAATVLLDWSNLVEADGKPITYSAGTAYRLFNDSPDFFNDIVAIAQDRALFREASVAVDSGN